MSAPTVVILAAGQGTRMRSNTPKPLHELCGRPMALWPVCAARRAGAGRIVVVDSPARALEPLLPEGVELAVQELPDGTGGATRAAFGALQAPGGRPLDESAPIVVLSGDVPLIDANAIGELVDAHLAAGAAATMVTAVLDDPSGYGRVVRDADGAVQRVVETKRPGDSTQAEREIREVNTGIFAFSPAALREALPRLRADNAQGELYLPQALDVVRARAGAVHAHVMDDPRLALGVNDRVSLARVRALAQALIHERHMLAGVTIVDPRATVIDVDVRIGQDTVIEPFTTIKGASVIGRECAVRHSFLHDCTLEDRVSVGPFGYLRPGTVLREGSKVGTFVEVKNSDIGARARVPHLSYIGDADVGQDTNLGAATITANYDGRAKHRTSVGSGVHTGVDTTFIAPVSVGDRAYTGAGSVITDDVPPGALGIARGRQRNVEGYAERASAPEAQGGDGPAGEAERARGAEAQGGDEPAGEAERTRA
ncbi:MAG TPA: bifunctional UDP-N-acetylglucosamine diphosphorylase/glucosamine-1-phosphate N-acetyltransferase GlmU [Solirubrobacteraceae bacterium]|nr:bifunctional UDP-N-acetylglucosamine diphosphorylase/glucosamine-1-phosphate N-acetyltransferase GlmU [Solirubrobacteraceae bacterium]